MRIAVALIAVYLLSTGCQSSDDPFAGISLGVAIVGDSTHIDCGQSADELREAGAVSVSRGESTLVIGHHQVTSINQNPVLARIDGDSIAWCRDDYETSGDDGTGYGLIWHESVLYGLFSATGSQGQASEDFRRFANSGWLTSYGEGGGGRVSIVARIDPESGIPDSATFVIARLSNGNSNSVRIRQARWDGLALHVQSDSFFSPLRTDRSRMECQGDSPFTWTLSLSADLSSAIASVADRCD